MCKTNHVANYYLAGGIQGLVLIHVGQYDTNILVLWETISPEHITYIPLPHTHTHTHTCTLQSVPVYTIDMYNPTQTLDTFTQGKAKWI